MKAMKKLVVKLVKDEQGGEVLEYALIAGLIVVAAIAAITSVGNKVLARWTSVSERVVVCRWVAEAGSRTTSAVDRPPRFNRVASPEGDSHEGDEETGREVGQGRAGWRSAGIRADRRSDRRRRDCRHYLGRQQGPRSLDVG